MKKQGTQITGKLLIYGGLSSIINGKTQALLGFPLMVY